MRHKILASIGVGSATVDTILHNSVTEPGGHLGGYVRIRGGAVEQAIDHVRIQLLTKVAVDSGDREMYQTRPFAEFTVSNRLQIAPGAERDVPFLITVPLHTPVTFPGTRHPVWLRTELGIPMALDPTDEDALQVRPTQAQNGVVEAMGLLGFRLAKVDVEHRNTWFRGSTFIQEFEFRPAARKRLRYDEIEIVFTHIGEGVELLLQVDRAARGLGGVVREMSGTDESWIRTSLPRETLAGGPSVIASGLEDVLRRAG